MSVIGSNILAGASGNQGYFLTNSLRFRSSASAYLNRTPASATNRQTWTWSSWMKRGSLDSWQIFFGAWDGAGGNDTTRLDLAFEAANTISITGGVTVFRNSTQVFRDPSAWYHIVVVADTTNATAQNRLRIYVNGVEITSWGTNNTVTQNTSLAVDNNASHVIGARGNSPTQYFDGYMTEINFIDGQALTPSSFGQTSAITGVWQPIKYTGTYGTNGFYLPFTDNSALTTSSNAGLGKDFSGNSNYWTTNNISITSGETYDSMTDVPTLTSATAGNYAVMNPLDAQGTATLSDANLTLASSTAAHKNRKATFVIPSTGKWYWELTTASTCSASVILGWGLQTTAAATDSQAGNADTFMAQNDANQDIFNQTTNVFSGGSAVAANAIRQVAYDAGTGKLWFGINNVWYSSTDLTSGNPSAGTNQCMTLSAGSYFPTITCYNLTANVNFGQQPFAYTPPTGFVALNTFNLPTPTIGATASSQANKYFDATLFTGTGANATITNSGSMQPDFIWGKSRSNAFNHILMDSVRGTGVTLFSNNTNADYVVTDAVTAFNSNGFNYGVDPTCNTNGSTNVFWQWRASNAAGVTNTSGTITSTVSANTSAGFSIVTYTGTGSAATVGHGLGVAPSMVIVKSRDQGTTGYTGNWYVYHASNTSAPETDYLLLNTTAATADDTFWNDTLPTSTVFSIGALSGTNDSGDAFVAYCFAPIAGYSAFGSYTGNGSTDGPFVFTGFRPRWLMIKRTDATQNWAIVDTSRDTFNVSNKRLFANLSDAEDTGIPNFVDLLSNGFKFRDSNVSCNASGGTYIYMAFAENPFKYANAR